MTTPIRNPKDAPPGAITGTPARVLQKLAVKVMRVRGVSSKGRRR